MSIAPPSDIILDVAQAADPRRLQAATAKLARMAAGVGTPPADFAALLPAPPPAAQPALAPSVAAPSAAPHGLGSSTLFASTSSLAPSSASPYQKFEAVLLQTFVSDMLPKDDDLFGDATSADACRSMLAEQLASQLAKSGKFGIAHLIEKAHGPQHVADAARAAAAAAPAPVEALPLALAFPKRS